MPFSFQFCCKCCQKERIIKEEYSLLTLGLGGAGKSTLLSKLCGEDDCEDGPTKGKWYSPSFLYCNVLFESLFHGANL